MQLAILLLLPLALASEPFYRRNDLLKHVVVILRHTDRAPLATYPGDPYKNHDWPLGYGRLTSRGRANARALGKWLRSHYNDFLSDDPREVDARSSPAPRCYETAALVLYGLYPANAVQREWEPDQPWQPVPITRLPDGNDKYSTICVPRVRAAIRSLIAVPEPAFLADNATLRKPLFGTLGGIVGFVARMSNLSEESSSGLFVTAIKMLDTMSVAKEYNLPVPTLGVEVLAPLALGFRDGTRSTVSLSDEPLWRRPDTRCLERHWANRRTAGETVILFNAWRPGPERHAKDDAEGVPRRQPWGSFRELLERNFGPVSKSECEWNDNQPLL
ncbi:hypothetical protein MRX96_012166 [Rhipicephalus microplus]